MKRLIKFILAILLIVLCTSISTAQIPRTLSYQGVLTDSSGNPKPDGVYSLVFRLYDTPTGGAELWREFKDIALKRGLFSTQLGDQTQFEPLLNFTKQYWLGIQYERDPEMLPRIPLSSVAYSFNSINSDSSQVALTTIDGAITTSKLGDLAVTTIKIEENAITSNKIVDGTIQSIDIGSGQVVKSLNGLKDHLFIGGAGGATVTTAGDSLIINAGSGTGGTGIQGVQNTNNTLDITNPNGPTATINVKNNGITSDHIADNAITSSKISLPYVGTTNSSTPAFQLTNTGTSNGLWITAANDAIVAQSTNPNKSGLWANR
ncbi:MAG: hypothetical protein QME58_06730 [Bacteroidota bacterium]|nr:hypothetical protein [Bacteroidota bacterium]